MNIEQGSITKSMAELIQEFKADLERRIAGKKLTAKEYLTDEKFFKRRPKLEKETVYILCKHLILFLQNSRLVLIDSKDYDASIDFVLTCLDKIECEPSDTF